MLIYLLGYFVCHYFFLGKVVWCCRGNNKLIIVVCCQGGDFMYVIWFSSSQITGVSCPESENIVHVISLSPHHINLINVVESIYLSVLRNPSALWH